MTSNLNKFKLSLFLLVPLWSAATTSTAPVQSRPNLTSLPATSRVWNADDFVVLSGAQSPRVAYALRREGTTFYLTLEVEAGMAEAVPGVQVGIAADKNLTLDEKNAKVTRGRDKTRYEFSVP